MAELCSDFDDLLIEVAGVEFMVVGGWAMAQGHSRGIDDLDAWVRATLENGRRVYASLARFGAPVDAAGLRSTPSPDLGRIPLRTSVATALVKEPGHFDPG